MSPEVVITGVGVVSPLGTGVEPFWQALLAGQSAVVDDAPEQVGRGTPWRFSAPCRGFDGKEFVQPRKALKLMSTDIQMGYAAAAMALKHADFRADQFAPDRLGAVFGSEIIHGELEELVATSRHCVEDGVLRKEMWGHHAMRDLFPLWMLKYLPNMTACHVGIAHNFQGPNNTLTGRDVSGMLATIEGCRYIERGAADAVLVGAASSYLNPATRAFAGGRELSTWTGPAAGAMRPFDVNRSGVVHGEGAAVLLLEEAESARRRGAKVLARLRGAAAGFSRGPGERPGRKSLARVVRSALGSAQIPAADVDHVNAHGDATVDGDRAESEALTEVLAEAPVAAYKGYFGHAGAATAMFELAIATLALDRRVAPATINCDAPDPLCPVSVIRGGPRELLGSAIVKTSLSPHGQTAAIVLSRN